jgi:hypothetical protein
MKSPQQKAPGAGELTGLGKLTTFANYYALTFTANIFGAVFWFFEQRRAKLQDRIANTESQQ